MLSFKYLMCLWLCLNNMSGICPFLPIICLHPGLVPITAHLDKRARLPEESPLPDSHPHPPSLSSLKPPEVTCEHPSQVSSLLCPLGLPPPSG